MKNSSLKLPTTSFNFGIEFYNVGFFFVNVCVAWP